MYLATTFVSNGSRLPAPRSPRAAGETPDRVRNAHRGRRGRLARERRSVRRRREKCTRAFIISRRIIRRDVASLIKRDSSCARVALCSGSARTPGARLQSSCYLRVSSRDSPMNRYRSPRIARAVLRIAVRLAVVALIAAGQFSIVPAAAEPAPRGRRPFHFHGNLIKDTDRCELPPLIDRLIVLISPDTSLRIFAQSPIDCARCAGVPLFRL